MRSPWDLGSNAHSDISHVTPSRLLYVYTHIEKTNEVHTICLRWRKKTSNEKGNIYLFSKGILWFFLSHCYSKLSGHYRGYSQREIKALPPTPHPWHTPPLHSHLSSALQLRQREEIRNMVFATIKHLYKISMIKIISTIKW